MFLTDLFRASAQAHRNRPALWVDGSAISYSELDDAAMRLAASIVASRGSARSGQCGLMVDRTQTAYAAVLGTMIAGSAYVPLNPNFPPERLMHMLMSSDVDVVIVDDRSIAAAREVLASCSRPLQVILPDFGANPDWAASLKQHRFWCRPDIEQINAPINFAPEKFDDGAYLLFTSGSTGAPKGVPITHQNALAYIHNVRERYRPGISDRFSQLFDFSFDLSIHDMFLCWSAGACLYCVPQSAGMGLRDFIRKHELTFWFSVPSAAAFMSRTRMLRRGDFPSLRWSLFCGEALPTRLARQWQEAAPNSTVENLYGPTEATIAFTTYRLPTENSGDNNEPDIVPIGFALPDQKTVVIDHTGRPLADGEVGELCLGGSQVAQGYWRAPEKSAEKFAPPMGVRAGINWYRTGDLAVNTARHGLIFMGRIDRQVKIRGYRVELDEIEAVLRSAAGTDTVGVIPWPMMANGLASGVIAFLSGRQIATPEIIDQCRKRLPDYMVPAGLHDVDVWPLNANGKTDYAALRSRLEKL